MSSPPTDTTFANYEALMIYTPRVKFAASLDASGNIIQGAAAAGFQAPTLASGTGEFHYLLENTTNGWETGYYKPANASGSRRFVVAGSSGGFAASTTGLTCSGIAPPEAFISQTDATTPPTNDGAYSMAVGHGAAVEGASQNAMAIGRLATAGNEATAVGHGSVARNAGLALGTNAKAFSDDYSGIFATGSSALGSRSVTCASGEVALGACSIGIPGNISHIPVAFAVVGATPGTYPMCSVGDDGAYGFAKDAIFTGNGGAFNPSNSYSNPSWRRVTGVVMLQTGTGPDDAKVWDVLMLLSPLAVISYSFTDVHHGVNNPAVTFSVDSAGTISATVPALVSPSLTGHLTVRRIFGA